MKIRNLLVEGGLSIEFIKLKEGYYVDSSSTIKKYIGLSLHVKMSFFHDKRMNCLYFIVHSSPKILVERHKIRLKGSYEYKPSFRDIFIKKEEFYAI